MSGTKSSPGLVSLNKGDVIGVISYIKQDLKRRDETSTHDKHVQPNLDFFLENAELAFYWKHFVRHVVKIQGFEGIRKHT